MIQNKTHIFRRRPCRIAIYENHIYNLTEGAIEILNRSTGVIRTRTVPHKMILSEDQKLLRDPGGNVLSIRTLSKITTIPYGNCAIAAINGFVVVRNDVGIMLYTAYHRDRAFDFLDHGGLMFVATRGGKLISCRHRDDAVYFDLCDFRWNNNRIAIQAPEIRRFVQFVILVLKRVAPMFDNRLTWLLISMIMKN